MVLKCERLLLVTLVVLVCLKTPCDAQHTWHCWINVIVENLSFKLYVWHNGIFLDFRGLLSEKSDDSLFFLDIGQPKKVEEKGKLVSLSSKPLYFYPLIYITLIKKMHLNKLVNLKFCFFCEEAAEPVKGKKKKGKSSRPLRIDLILQHDSLVAPPKESVILVSSDPWICGLSTVLFGGHFCLYWVAQ